MNIHALDVLHNFVIPIHVFNREKLQSANRKCVENPLKTFLQLILGGNV